MLNTVHSEDVFIRVFYSNIEGSLKDAAQLQTYNSFGSCSPQRSALCRHPARRDFAADLSAEHSGRLIKPPPADLLVVALLFFPVVLLLNLENREKIAARSAQYKVLIFESFNNPWVDCQ